MSIIAKDIMHPKMSLHAKMDGQEVVERLMSPYPALPVVNGGNEVIGIVSEFDILGAVMEGRTIHEFSAESIMSCGHAEHEHGVCSAPVTVNQMTPIEDIVDMMHKTNFTILPVVNKKELVGIISRKNVINAMAEPGFWDEHEFMKRV